MPDVWTPATATGTWALTPFDVPPLLTEAGSVLLTESADQLLLEQVPNSWTVQNNGVSTWTVI